MKKKEKLFIVILFSLSLSAILTNVLGQTSYTCEAKVGDEYIYKITKLDARLATLVDIELGDKIKYNITDITEETNYFIIETDIWEYISNNDTWEKISNNESFGATADDQYIESVYKDPSDNDTSINLYVLSPVSVYLAEYAEANPNYSSSGNVLTHSIISIYTIVRTFDSNGILTKMQYSNSTNVLLVLSRLGSL